MCDFLWKTPHIRKQHRLLFIRSATTYTNVTWIINFIHIHMCTRVHTSYMHTTHDYHMCFTASNLILHPPDLTDQQGSRPEVFLSRILWSSTHDTDSTLVSWVVYHPIRHPSQCFFTLSAPSNRISQFHWTFCLGLCHSRTDPHIATMDHLVNMVAQRGLEITSSFLK